DRMDWSRPNSRRLSHGAVGHAEESHVQGDGWIRAPWTVVRQHGEYEARARREKTGDHLRPRRSAAPNAARVEIQRLLLQRLRVEAVSGEPRVHCAVGELPAGDWVWARFSASSKGRR